MSLKTFLLSNWLGLLGLIVGFIGIFLSVYFYKASIDYREPIFMISPTRTEIVEADNIANTPIRVVRDDGSQIEGDISSVWLYFWNQGRLSIKKDNIISPLNVSLDDLSGEILDYKIVAKTREIINASIWRHKDDKKRKLNIAFDILEEMDGFTIQIIYTGSQDATFSMAGNIEGVKNEINDSHIQNTQFWRIYGKKAKFLFFVFSTITIFYVVPFIYKKYEEKLSLSFMKLATKFLIIFFSLVFCLVIFVFARLVIINPIKEAKIEAIATMDEIVPSQLKVPLKKNRTNKFSGRKRPRR